MQKSLSACRAILSDESDESDGSEGERTAVHPSERDIIDEVALPVIERAERPRVSIYGPYFLRRYQTMPPMARSQTSVPIQENWLTVGWR